MALSCSGVLISFNKTKLPVCHHEHHGIHLSVFIEDCQQSLEQSPRVFPASGPTELHRNVKRPRCRRAKRQLVLVNSKPLGEVVESIVRRLSAARLECAYVGSGIALATKIGLGQARRRPQTPQPLPKRHAFTVVVIWSFPARSDAVVRQSCGLNGTPASRCRLQNPSRLEPRAQSPLSFVTLGTIDKGCTRSVSGARRSQFSKCRSRDRTPRDGVAAAIRRPLALFCSRSSAR